MPVDLAELAAPAHTALLTMEVQRGVVGDLARFGELAATAAETGLIGNAARLAAAARGAGVRVVHCTAAFRADRAGSHTANTPFIRVLLRDPGHMREGTPAVEVVPELGPCPGDLESRRYHGFSPFTGTSLDTTLRSLGVRTVVVAGVSLNLGVPGLALEAVNLGYRVVVAADAVAGTPRAYGEQVMAHTIALLAARASTDDLTAIWG
ncbi:MAG TPA: isochorismatase family protein [Streptosporangiaceae bacterium]